MEVEPVLGAVECLMRSAQIGRHEVRLVEVGQRRFGVRQTVMSSKNLPSGGRLLEYKRHRTTASYAHFADGYLVEEAEKVGHAIYSAM